MAEPNKEVSHFLDSIYHPFRKEIELLRGLMLSTNDGLIENIKWNGPNYQFNGEDRITMRIQPPTKLIQLIFHCGAKVKALPHSRIISEDHGLLEWKENNRAVATFKNLDDIILHQETISKVVNDWLLASF